jgi:hypothetical protein
VSDHEQLTRELRERAGRVGGHPVSLEEVRRRARRIRWQRGGAAAAVGLGVLTVLVPAGILAGRSLHSQETPPAVTTPTAPTPTRSSRTGPVSDHVSLRGDVPAGEPPAVAYFGGGAIHTGSGAVPVDQDLSSLAAYDGGWVGSARQGKDGFTTFVYDARGEVLDRYASTGPVAVSADRTLAAFSTPDGRVMALRDTEPSPVELRTEGSGSYLPVSVGGAEGQCVDPEGTVGSDCGVFYADGATPRSYTAHAHGNLDILPVRKVAGISPEGWLSGTVSVSDDGSCSAVFDDQWRQRWRTCEYTLGRFSADGRYVIGRPAYLSGIGDGLLAILDARTGEVLVDARPDEGGDAFVADAVWQPDGTVLATVWDDGWALLRLTPDGRLTRAVSDLAGEAEEAPVVLEGTP